MDKTQLVQKVSELMRIANHDVKTSVEINFREIDIVAEEQQGFPRQVKLIECADYNKPVGIQKLAEDLDKLKMALEKYGYSGIAMHVSSKGYTQKAKGFAIDEKLPIYTLEDLEKELINFSSYIKFVTDDPQKATLIREYQLTKIHPEGEPEKKEVAIDFLKSWLKTDSNWLTVLGDYGVGKSWLLKRLLYQLMDEYKDTRVGPIPFFIPLQRFCKAFDFQNLIMKTFEIYGLHGITYSSFKYLADKGSIIFLLDSFDEMAQTLGKETLRENLNELLSCVSNKSKVIMTSRPTYFESRAEKLSLVENEDGFYSWHSLDQQIERSRAALSREIEKKLDRSSFARLNDLDIIQRKKLFSIVLQDKPEAHNKLLSMLDKYTKLGELSERPVIARLLTLVAQEISNKSDEFAETKWNIEECVLNQGKIFEIVVDSLLERDKNLGHLNAWDRIKFLRTFACYLQRSDREFFATPDQIKKIVEDLYQQQLRSSENYNKTLENYYRTCRRHAGLTTEKQFLETTGFIDMPVHEEDLDSRVGFSHNSLREYLVADAFCEFILNNTNTPYIQHCSITQTIADFIYDNTANKPTLLEEVKHKFSSNVDSLMTESLFTIIYKFISNDPNNINLLGNPPTIESIDLSELDLSSLPLQNACIVNSILHGTDFRKSSLQHSSFSKSILNNTMFDLAALNDADFTDSEIQSIYVYDNYIHKTVKLLDNKESRQWLFCNNAKVDRSDLNLLLKEDWYIATQEVSKTIQAKFAGTFKESSLWRGTRTEYRSLAKDFVEYLKKALILKTVKKDKGADNVVRVNKKYRRAIQNFLDHGRIATVLAPFFKKKIDQNQMEFDLDKLIDE